MNTKIIAFVIFVFLMCYGYFIYYKCSPDEENFHNEKEGIFDYKPNKKIRLISNLSSIGTKVDAEIYNKIIPNSYICYYKQNKNIPHDEIIKSIDLNIYFEKIMLDLPAKQHWLVVNQEFLSESLHQLQKIDKFICKSKYAYNLLIDLKTKYKLKGQIEYIGHTSHSNNDENILNNKNMNLFIHCAGKSHMKNTNKVIKAWKMIHKKYPNNYLVITCRGQCKKKITEKLNNSDSIECKNCDIDDLLKEHSNVSDGIIYKNFIDNEDYKKYVKHAICYICPSQVEGFGHYINEGRSNCAAIITTDGPPMNELVVDAKNGYTVPVSKTENSKNVTNLHRNYIPFIDFFEKIFSKNVECENSQAFDVSEKDLYHTIEKFIQLNNHDKLKMCYNSRKMYDTDRVNFKNKLLQLINV